MKHNGEKRWGWVPHLLRIIGLMIGAGILFYPTISSQWNKYRDSRLISEYSHKVDSYSEDQYKEVWESAKAYNDQHSTNFIMDAFDENTEESSPYYEDPGDIRSISFESNGDVLHGNVYKTDIIELIKSYKIKEMPKI